MKAETKKRLINDITECLKQMESVREQLLEQEEEEKEENIEKTYPMGTKFMYEYSGKIYILAHVDFKQVSLIGIEGGNRWSTPINVDSTVEITQQELDKLTGDYKFTKI